MVFFSLIPTFENFLIFLLLALMVKNLPTNSGDVRDTGWIPGLLRSLGTGNGNPLQFAWKIPLTEGPGGLQSMGLQRVRHNWVTEYTHTDFLKSHTIVVINDAWYDFSLRKFLFCGLTYLEECSMYIWKQYVFNCYWMDGLCISATSIWSTVAFQYTLSLLIFLSG